LAWALVLSVTSAQSRPVFGTVLFGRMQGGQGIDQAMGMFINTLPVCIDLEHQSVAQALQQTHQRLTALLSHEHASLSLAQQCSGVPAGVPLFTSMLNYRYMADATQGSQGGAWEGMQVLGGQERSNYPITVSINDDGRLFSVDMQVAIPGRAHRLLACLQNALQQLWVLVSESDSSALRGIQMLGEQEQALLSRWGAHHTPGLSPVPLHHLFEQQVARDGQRLAVENGSVSITYAQLNAQANQLAHYLLAQGVSVEDKIGVALDRSLTQIVALLAIAKAGAAFVPLDLAYPPERLQYMAQDSGLRCLLTVGGVARPVWLAESVSVLALDALPLSDYPSGNPSVAVQAGHLAYVMYTSGSTGQPKGVETVHQGVYRLVYQPNFMRLDGSTRMLQFAPITFDASTLEIWGALCNGGTLVQAPAGLLDYAQLGQVIEGSGVNTAWLTAALFNR
ncbi:AMP-binding protein, partial [Alcaligenes faecalis]|uniref:AMP-binding protein n=1 Tax=Alcaligenes faecalis TaxID=511 RepID=UPI00293285DA